jgi:hypothetical protein
VLALVAANAVSLLLLGTLCFVRLSGHIGSAAFLTCLAGLFLLATALWVRSERGNRRRAPLRRLSGVVGALVLAMALAPMVVLTPMFWLHAQLPPEAGFDQTIGRAMAAMLMALVLAVGVNAVGGMVVVVRTILGRARGLPPRASSP